MTHPLIEKFNAKKRNPNVNFDSFSFGDEVCVGVEIDQGTGTKVQEFRGLCIAKRRKGINSNFIVRKIGEGNTGIERNFQINSSRIKFVNKLKSHKVKRAKLYFIRELRGKSARLKVKSYF